MNDASSDRSNLLRLALRSNAVFSTVSGIAFIAAAAPLSEWIGLGSLWILNGVGVSLIVFAVGLYVNASRPDVNVLEAWIAVALDLGWVAGSAVVITLGFLTTSGNWAVAVVADVVLVFAIVQYFGLRQLNATAAGRTA